jgi:hypothetical protein
MLIKKSGAYLSAWSFAGLLSSFLPEKEEKIIPLDKKIKKVF